MCVAVEDQCQGCCCCAAWLDLEQLELNLCVPQVLVCLYGWLTKAPDSPLHVLKAGSTAGITLTAAAGAAGATVVLSDKWQEDAKGVHIADSWDEEAAGYRAPEVNPDQPVPTCCLVAAYDAVQELMKLIWNKRVVSFPDNEACRLKRLGLLAYGADGSVIT